MHYPLFKGMTTEQLSTILENLKLDFITYKDRETILGEGDNMTSLGFVVKGEVALDFELYDGKIMVRQILDRGFWLLPECLFGYRIDSPVKMQCIGYATIFWIGKKQLETLLKESDLCRLNYINHLCYISQTRYNTTNRVHFGTIFERWLSGILMSITERRAKRIELHVPQIYLAEILNITEAQVREQMQPMIRRGKISYTDNVIKVFNRRDYF